MDPRIDQYIENSAPFAKPVLNYLRALVHKTCPEVKESLKWSFPHFDYNNKILCSMAAFKNHCSFGFRNAKAMSDPDQILESVGKTAMGHMGRISSLEDLPKEEILVKYILHAMEIDGKAQKPETAPKATSAKEVIVPEDMLEQFARHADVALTFQNFSYSNKKEYVDWISEAKSADTRNKRLSQAIEWMAEGKIRHWKYVKKQ